MIGPKKKVVSFGKMIIEHEKDFDDTQHAKQLRIRSERMITLAGKVVPFAGNRFKVEWDNKNAASDAFLIMQTNLKNEVTGMTMHPFVSLEKERHEYRDMHFLKQ